MKSSTIHSILRAVVAVALVALTTPHLAGQVDEIFSLSDDGFIHPFCSLVTEDVAAELLHQRVIRDSGSCTWWGANNASGQPDYTEELTLIGVHSPEVGGQASSFNVVEQAFDAMRSDLKLDIHDEPTVGERAFSGLRTSNNVEFLCVNGHFMLDFSLRVAGAPGQRSEMRDVMRKLCTFSPEKEECDHNASGQAMDYYGVPGGKSEDLDLFLADRGGKTHPGIDVERQRSAPVFANLRDSIPIAELNSARMLSTKQTTGLAIPGSGVAFLVDAQVRVQPWPPKDIDDLGAIIGLAAHYRYTGNDGKDQKFTIYVEYEHLIGNGYLPRNNHGVYIDKQNKPIQRGAYRGCQGFGTQVQNDFAVLKLDQLNQRPLIGYLGATEHPHVHIQAAFALGSPPNAYIQTSYFDPGVVLAGH